jgi:hypothetical protein
MQEVLRKGTQLLRRFHQPLQHGVRVHLAHPSGTSDASAFGQARDDAHEELDGGALTIKECAGGLEKIVATGDAQQLPPTATIGIAIGPEMAPADPTPIGTIRIGAEMV